MADEDGRARSGERLQARGILEVRAGDLDASREQQGRDAPHARSTDPDEVDGSPRREVRRTLLRSGVRVNPHAQVQVGSLWIAHGAPPTRSTASASRPAASGWPNARDRAAIDASPSGTARSEAIRSASTSPESCSSSTMVAPPMRCSARAFASWWRRVAYGYGTSTA